MKLIGADASPFVQRVKIAARLKGLDLPLAPLPADGLKGETFRGLNPMARMPVLLAEDGWALGESATIAMFLDETVGGAPLLPSDPRDRARVRWLVQLVDGPLDAGIRIIVRSRVMPGSTAPMPQRDSSDLADLGLEELNEALSAIAALTSGRNVWLVGETATLADAALFPVLEMIEVLRPWNRAHAQISMPAPLADYRQRLLGEPIFREAASDLQASFRHVAGLWGLIAA